MRQSEDILIWMCFGSVALILNKFVPFVFVHNKWDIFASEKNGNNYLYG